ncbi:MAG: AMMECR1 domain-containing protein [Planctomycetota bacterium]|nr:AMMECR1 domain-containing protein [Planctomycetota bacterium]MDA1143045.1 AMMECR1 domain-containing protein [Planctomycetota bacterium]
MNLISGALTILALLPCLQAEQTKFTQEEKVALMQHARSLLLDHFEAGSSPLADDVLKRLEHHKHKVFVLIRNQGKSRGCYSGGGANLPQRLSSAMRNTLKDDRYGGGLQKHELAFARIELFILQPELKLEKDWAAIDARVNLGVDSIRLSGKVGTRKQDATFLNYVPITSGYSTGRMLDRLASKAGIRGLAIPYLQDVIRRSKNGEWQAYVALTEVGSREKDELPAALELFVSPEKSKRELGGLALLHLIEDAIKNERTNMTKVLLASALPALKAALKNPDVSTRLDAATGLKLLGPHAGGAMADLVVIAEKDSSTEVRSEAAKALLMIIKATKDKKPEGLPSSKALLEIAARHSAERQIRSLPSLQSGVIARAVLAHPDSEIFLVPTVHLLETSAPKKVVELYRCNTLVRPQEVHAKSVTESVRLGGEWFLNAQRWDGSQEYMWFVNTARYSTSANNMIRQWMATLCLNELGRFFVEDKYHEASRRNLAFNMQQYFREDPESGLGFIYFREKCKLGSAAFAVRSLLHIDHKKEYDHQLQALRKFLFFMFRDDGSFRSIYYPDRKDKFSESDDFLQRYYSGEGLVALMEIFTRKGDREAYEAVEKAFAYHRDYYKEDGHPASIPWLTQAYVRAHSIKPNKEYADFVFEMSDFILSIQNMDQSPPDHYGRFSAPKWRKTYGPPFAASTGVYLEGLVDAYKLAKSLGEEKRTERYRISIILACRSLMQLQFRDDNLFFVKDVFRTRGGVRGDVMSTIIRIDNTQHAIQGMMRAVQALDSWELLKQYRLE